MVNVCATHTKQKNTMHNHVNWWCGLFFIKRKNAVKSLNSVYDKLSTIEYCTIHNECNEATYLGYMFRTVVDMSPTFLDTCL